MSPKLGSSVESMGGYVFSHLLKYSVTRNISSCCNKVILFAPLLPLIRTAFTPVSWSMPSFNICAKGPIPGSSHILYDNISLYWAYNSSRTICHSHVHSNVQPVHSNVQPATCKSHLPNSVKSNVWSRQSQSSNGRLGTLYTESCFSA